MKFEPGNIYTNRAGSTYTFVRKASGSVIIFEHNNKLTCRHERGTLRWDDAQTDEDIVS